MKFLNEIQELYQKSSVEADSQDIATCKHAIRNAAKNGGNFVMISNLKYPSRVASWIKSEGFQAHYGLGSIGGSWVKIWGWA